MPYLGNAALMALPERVAFLSSRRIAPADVLRCCDWAAGMRGEGACVLEGIALEEVGDVAVARLGQVLQAHPHGMPNVGHDVVHEKMPSR